MSVPVEFSRPVRVETLPRDGLRQKIAANEAERAALGPTDLDTVSEARTLPDQIGAVKYGNVFEVVTLSAQPRFWFDSSGLPFRPFFSAPSSAGGATAVDEEVEKDITFVIDGLVSVVLVARFP